jgi:hypothetical protein
LGPFVTNHQNIAIFIIAPFDGGKSVFFTIKAARCSGKFQHLHPGHFDQRAFWCEIAAQPDNTTCW